MSMICTLHEVHNTRGAMNNYCLMRMLMLILFWLHEDDRCDSLMLYYLSHSLWLLISYKNIIFSCKYYKPEINILDSKFWMGLSFIYIYISIFCVFLCFFVCLKTRVRNILMFKKIWRSNYVHWWSNMFFWFYVFFRFFRFSLSF